MAYINNGKVEINAKQLHHYRIITEKGAEQKLKVAYVMSQRKFKKILHAEKI